MADRSSRHRETFVRSRGGENVRERFTGPVVVVLILGGVLVVLAMNLDLSGRPGSSSVRTGTGDRSAAIGPDAAGGPVAKLETRSNSAGAGAAADSGPIAREYPIGEELERNQMRIAAVWLPSEPMAGMPPHKSSADLVHIEADIKAAEGNRNGFAQDEKIPYLPVRYTIAPLARPDSGGAMITITGTMIPMVARDGFHYGATIEMPGSGKYRVTYHIDPPSMGRHTDVDPWWKPFEVAFDWDYPGPPKP
jgi:uncharacterized protein involved in high-affinity Fe2+ transport